MAAVGILGGNPNETAVLFLRMCQEKGQKAMASLYNLTENFRLPIVSIDENEKTVPQILILQDTTNYDFVRQWQEDCKDGESYLIVNADNISSAAFPPLRIISYGFNQKASVTASSVFDEALQICIQRGFLSLSGRAYEAQEFKAACPSGVSPHSVLGAATACALCDVF